ncbi:MAG: YDG domain-containing protein, partial [Prevotellaceae bacterium]|nr:YDG domain-containing protein [Prevotellaceae bacterium]
MKNNSKRAAAKCILPAAARWAVRRSMLLKFCLLLCGSLLAASMATAAETTIGGCTYEITGSGSALTLTIRRAPDGNGEMPNYYTGTAPWYSDRANIKTLVVASGVTKIGNYAFYNCKNLTGSLTLPSGITSIGIRAFSGCNGFKGDLILPSGLISLGNNAFTLCDGFEGSLIFPIGLETIGNTVFNGCSFTGSLILPEGLTKIGDEAFSYISGFNGELVLPSTLISIGDGAFLDCRGLTGSLTLPEGFTSIGKNAFEGCRGLTGSITLPSTLVTIGKHAFAVCAGGGMGILTVYNYRQTPQTIEVDDFTYTYLGGKSGLSLYVPCSAINAYTAATEWSTFGFIGSIDKCWPSAPQGFTAKPGNAQVTLSWSAPISNGGSAVTKYKVQKDGGNWIDVTSGTTYTFTGLTNGTEYAFKVRAVNAMGDGAESVEKKATPCTVPGVPRTFTATPGNAQVALSWLAPASDGGSAVTKYQVQVSSGSWIDVTSGTTYTFTGLTNTLYTFKVRAFNAAGSGAEVSATATPYVVPGAPTSLAATPGNAQVTLLWLAPASTGGSAITRYQVQVDGDSWTNATTDGATYTCTVTGLTNGTEYAFKIRAVNAAGNGAESGEKKAIPCNVPDAPTSLAAAPGNAQVALSWSAPASDGGSAIIKYKVQVDNNNWIDVMSGTTYTFTSLANGTLYTFRVRAVNAAGESTAASTTATPYGVPGAPATLTATPDNEQVTLSWSASASNGSAITKYQVQVNGGGWTNNETANGTTYTYTVTGLTNGIEYTFKVRAVNAADNGAESVERKATPCTVPGAPQSFTATPGNGQIALSWSAPVSDGGSAVTGYEVQKDGDAGWTNVPSSTPTYTFTSLASGTLYTFRVRAVNAAGSGAAAELPASVLLTVTVVVGSRPYDGTAAAIISTATLNGVPAGKAVTLTWGVGTFGNASAGTGKPVSFTAFTLAGADAAGYALAQPAGVTGDITPRPLTAGSPNVTKSKVYDRTSSAAVTAGTLNGVLDGDDVELTATAAYSDSLAGEDKRITVRYTLTGNAAATSNYTAPASEAYYDGAITPKPLTAGSPNVTKSKVYDKTSAAAVTAGTLSGVVGGDDVELTATAAYSDSLAGKGKTITVRYTLTGNAAVTSNYTAPDSVAYDDGIIEARVMEVSGTSVQLQKVYDGADSAHVTALGSLTNKVNGDAVIFTATAVYDTKQVGDSKTITVTYALTGGADKDNYAAPARHEHSSLGEITAQPLTLPSLSVERSKVYDGNVNAAVTPGDLSGRVGAENVGLTATAAYDTKLVGGSKAITVTYTLTGDALAMSNYSAPGNAAYNDGVITAKPLTVSGTSVQEEKVYDGSDSAHVTFAGSPGGVVDGDTVYLTATAAYNSPDPGDDKPITVTYGLTGSAAGCYVEPAPGTGYRGRIVSGAQLTVSGTTVQLTKVYDGDDSARVTFAGTLDGVYEDDKGKVSLRATATYSSLTAGGGKTITVTYNLVGDAKDKYAAPGSASFSGGVITPKPLTVGAPNITPTKPYDGKASAAVAAGTLVGRVGSDPVTVTATGAYSDSAVGYGKAITVSYALSGDAAVNYAKPSDSTYVDIGEITPRVLTVSALTVEPVKAYDGSKSAVVTVQPAITNAVDGENVSLTAMAEYSDKEVGDDKPITVTYINLGGTHQENYALPSSHSYRSNGEITQRVLTVADLEVQLVKEYDGSRSAQILVPARITNAVDGESVTLTATAAYSNASVGKPKAITVTYSGLSGDDSASYALPGSYTYSSAGEITKRQLEVSGLDVSLVKEYDGSNSAQINTLPGITNAVA